MQIVLATQNPHKIRELLHILKSVEGIDFLPLNQFPHYEAPEETGTTIEENARLKARHASQALHQWTLAEDSGLVVPVLNGAPGVISARYAGSKASDKENRQKLLRAMEGIEGEDRAAHFECVLALCSPSGDIRTFSGSCYGRILPEERGGNGFGYDSLFLKEDYDKTFAELPENIKNRVSHRSKAAEKLILHLSHKR